MTRAQFVAQDPDPEDEAAPLDARAQRIEIGGREIGRGVGELILAVLAQVAKQLPNDGAYLKEWDYQNGKLRMTVASPNKPTQ